MRKYIAFLRGINVGGKNKISMYTLKELFKQIGFEDVLTYINSGNIIFSSGINDSNRLQEICETMILERLELKISIAIISVEDLLNIYKHAPEWWDKEIDSKHNAIIVIYPTTVAEVLKKVGEIKLEYEKVDYCGEVIFWSAPIKTFSRTRWSKVVGMSIYDRITIRNANTIKKLLQLVE